MNDTMITSTLIARSLDWFILRPLPFGQSARVQCPKVHRSFVRFVVRRAVSDAVDGDDGDEETDDDE